MVNLLLIIGKDGCKYCTMAIEFSKKHGINYIYKQLDPSNKYYDTETAQLKDETKRYTFPYIFTYDPQTKSKKELIGGYTCLVKAYNTLLLNQLGIKNDSLEF